MSMWNKEFVCINLYWGNKAWTRKTCDLQWKSKCLCSFKPNSAFWHWKHLQMEVLHAINFCLCCHFSPYGYISIYSPENILFFKLKVFKLTVCVLHPQKMTGKKKIAYLLILLVLFSTLHIYLGFCVLSVFWKQ